MDIIILGGIVLGLTEIIKKASKINTNFIPIIALVITFVLLGIYVVSSNTAFTWELIQSGIIVALTSVGLYSGVKSTLK